MRPRARLCVEPPPYHVPSSRTRLTSRDRASAVSAAAMDSGATLDDLREALNTTENLTLTARHVFGGAHPMTVDLEHQLQESRAALRARETPSGNP